MKGLSISQVANATQVNNETVRYYEKRGLIPDPPRTESGYRVFPFEVIERIQFIKRAQELGFTLEEIKQMLLVSDDATIYDSKEIQEFATQKIDEIESKINDLQKMKFVLKDLTKQCPGSGHPLEQCPIIKNFLGGETNG